MKKSPIHVDVRLTAVVLISFIHAIAAASVPPNESLPHPKKGNPTQFDVISSEQAKRRGINVYPQGIRPIGLIRSQTSMSLRALAILVEFADRPALTHPTMFDTLLFDEGKRSLRSYYREVSYGSLDIVTVQLPSERGWIDLPRQESYYAGSASGLGMYPQNSQRLVEDALAAADSAIDFSQYDNDGDGFVDALFIVHSGPGAEFSGSINNIWSHQWTTSAPVKLDNVSAYVYSMQPEYWRVPGDMTCGVFAHEAGHMLFGLPDLYDTDHSSNGLGRWSLMAFGSWNGQLGDTPAHPDAWSRIAMGFAEPVLIDSLAIGYDIGPIELEPVILKMWKNGIVGKEYFLAENRQLLGFDAALRGTGLCVYHVDKSRAGNQSEGGTIPSTGHYKVSMVQADGAWDLEEKSNSGEGGDPFPGTSGNLFFNQFSAPSSSDYEGNPTFVSISDITDSGKRIVANVTVDSAAYCVIPERFGPLALTAMIGEIARDSFRIVNPGYSALAVSEITSTINDIQINLSPFVIPPAGHGWIHLAVTPESIGTTEEAVSIIHNGVNPPLTFSIPITGLGVEISMSSDQIDLGRIAAGMSATDSVSVTNTGNMPAVNLMVTTDTPHLSVSNPQLNLEPGESTILGVNCTPAEAGPIAGTVTFSFGDGNRHQVQVSASVVPFPIRLSPEFLTVRDFDTVTTSLIDFTNELDQPLRLTIHVSEEPGVIVAKFDVAGRSSARAEVRLTEETKGARSLSVRDEEGGILATIPVIPESRRDSVEVRMNKGWNLVAKPFASGGEDAVQFPLGGDMYTFDGEIGYVTSGEMGNGRGYWMRCPESLSLKMYGEISKDESLSVNDGWNLIGIQSGSVSVGSIHGVGVSIMSNFYGYERGYFSADTLVPGSGYWVKVDRAGVLFFDGSDRPASRARGLAIRNSEHTSSLIFTDASGIRSTVSFGISGGSIELSSELPPSPPEGVFDVRSLPPAASPNAAHWFALENAAFPIHVELEGSFFRENESLVLIDAHGSVQYLDRTHASAVLTLETASVSITPGGRVTEEPSAYALLQNFPNPFNSSTTISFTVGAQNDLQKRHVSVRIFNALGEEIASLLDGPVEGVSGSVNWNAGQLPSGVYYCVMESNGRLKTQRLVLLR